MDDRNSNDPLEKQPAAGKCHGIRAAGSRIAPAVALLLMADSAQAIDGEDTSSDTFSVPEPSTLGLLAAGAAIGGLVAWVRSRRRK
jgi:hypothetical protein